MAACHAFKKLCKNVGLDPKLYGLHSPRVGAATDAYLAGIPGPVIDLRGRWKSCNTKKRYCRPTIEMLLAYDRGKTS
jgi:hypothetical protein